MESWYWVLAILLGCSGVALFSLSYLGFDREARTASRWAQVLGLAGLLLLAWGVLLAVLGAVIAVVRALSP